MRLVRTKRYTKDLKRIGATRAEIDALEHTIACHPTVGSVIPGLGGVRKIRFGIGTRGKRGGARAIYFAMIDEDLALMLFAYSKSDRDDMTADERKVAAALMGEFTGE